MMKTKHGGTKYVRYSEGYTIVHVCDTEVKLYPQWQITTFIRFLLCEKKCVSFQNP